MQEIQVIGRHLFNFNPRKEYVLTSMNGDTVRNIGVFNKIEQHLGVKIYRFGGEGNNGLVFGEPFLKQNLNKNFKIVPKKINEIQILGGISFDKVYLLYKELDSIKNTKISSALDNVSLVNDWINSSYMDNGLFSFLKNSPPQKLAQYYNELLKIKKIK